MKSPHARMTEQLRTLTTLDATALARVAGGTNGGQSLGSAGTIVVAEKVR